MNNTILNILIISLGVGTIGAGELQVRQIRWPTTKG